MADDAPTPGQAAGTGAEPDGEADVPAPGTAAARQADAVYKVTGKAPAWAMKWPGDGKPPAGSPAGPGEQP